MSLTMNNHHAAKSNCGPSTVRSIADGRRESLDVDTLLEDQIASNHFKSATKNHAALAEEALVDWVTFKEKIEGS